MDVQMAPPTYAAAGNPAPPSGNPPVLGQQIPGMSGGLPAQGGLPVTSNPMAEQLRSQGRGEDSMLIHMTPGEVNSLQGLAMAHGGSLTINPDTGLPEAGWLGKLLPTILGAALAATGVGAPLAAGIVGAGQFARTGSLKKGLMAGLGAFGGAGMAGMAGLGGSITNNAFGVLGDKAGMFGANMGLGAAIPASQIAPVAVTADTAANMSASQLAGPMNVPASGIAGGPGATSVTLGGPTAAASPMGAAINSPEFARQFATSVGNMPAPAMQGAQFTGGLGSRFGQAVRAGLPGGTPGIISKAAPMMAGMGVLSNVSSAMTPSMGTVGSDGMVDNSYQGPYTAQERKASFADDTSEILGSSKERRYFDVDMPEIYNMQGQIVQPGSSTARGTPIMQDYLLPTNKKTPKGSPMYGFRSTPYMTGYAEGGEVADNEFQMADGGFVVDALSVARAGEGLTKAGFNEFKKLGGVPITGPGDGVSDSIPARIGRDQPARVAAGEVYIPPEAVKKIGKGNPEHGADRLFAMMKRAHKASKPGQKHNLLRGLA